MCAVWSIKYQPMYECCDWTVAQRKPDRSKFPLRDDSQIVKYNLLNILYSNKTILELNNWNSNSEF
jgi:hypothetical protein